MQAAIIAYKGIIKGLINSVRVYGTVDELSERDYT